MCLVCEELNEEKELVTISEIRILGSYYNWGCEIHYCPWCGERITHEKRSTNENKHS